MKLFAASLFLLTASAAVAQQTTPSITIGPDTTLLNITAEGRSLRTPDLATFSAGVVTQSKTASEALSGNATRMNAVVAALKRAGIADRDIQTSSLNLQPVWSNPERERQLMERMARQPGATTPPIDPEPKIVGYEARNTVQVRVRRLGEMGRIIDTLVGAGANQVDGPNFTLDDSRAALDEARTDAMQAARQRAELYARAAGLRVGRIISISEQGGYYPVQEIMVTAQRGGAGAPPPPPSPVAPGELQLGVNLSVQFALER